MPQPFYLTTTIPYVNAKPHLGFALELVQADIIARVKRLQGYDVFFNTGTDEHGLKVYRKALEEGMDPQVYVDQCAAKYRELLRALNISPDANFIRTTDPAHKEAAQEFWRRCKQNGFIYKRLYKVKYCVGCELEKTDSELLNGRCPIHPNVELEQIEEENWFFKLSAFTEYLLKLYARKDFVIPDVRLNELRSLIRGKGLQDFSASRLTEKLPWGVPVPDDPTQVAYVWFDAFVNYLSAIGWPRDMEKFDRWWIESGGVLQFAGKDQVRQQAAMWQAMLSAAGLPPSKQIVIHGFITSGGEKMSKSLGNVVDPFALVKEYGKDAVRWFLARHVHPFEDSDFTLLKFKTAYNADLANGLGNLTSRIMKMAEQNEVELGIMNYESGGEMSSSFRGAIEKFDIQSAATAVSARVSAVDKKIQETRPFELVKKDKPAAVALISGLVRELYALTFDLEPIMPETSTTIRELIKANKSPVKPLFPRKE